ncbi:XdhC family protein [Streptomyces sp. NPDC005167]
MAARHGSPPSRLRAPQIGSVSGGCVEGAVYELCQEALETRAPSSSASGYSADDAFAVGRRPRTLADPRLRPAPPALTSRGAGGLGRSGSGGDVSPARGAGLLAGPRYRCRGTGLMYFPASGSRARAWSHGFSFIS